MIVDPIVVSLEPDEILVALSTDTPGWALLFAMEMGGAILHGAIRSGCARGDGTDDDRPAYAARRLTGERSPPRDFTSRGSEPIACMDLPLFSSVHICGMAGQTPQLLGFSSAASLGVRPGAHKMAGPIHKLICDRSHLNRCVFCQVAFKTLFRCITITL